ncbi:MAG: tyrosine-type recombinase/integrase [Phycisphaerae bacterium]|jgi:integrase|nr:tyrosine-type recombinase/integrase [Phycisphaerae bacterium]
MASVCRTKYGTKQIQFSPDECPTVPAGSRPKIGLGKINARQAANICGHVEQLCRAKKSQQSIPDATAAWVADLAGKLRSRLEALALVNPKVSIGVPTIEALADEFIAARADVKESTRIGYRQVKSDLVGFFKADRSIDTITPADAKQFKIHLGTKRNLATGTVNRRCRRAKQFFAFAVDSRYLSESPFAKVKAGQSVNSDNFAFIDPETTKRLIEAAPDVQWRLIIALARYAGLRIPSELLPLKWSDVLWDQKRINITSPKTAHQGKPERVIPLFPELETILSEAYALATPGDTYIITRYRDTTQNLRTTLLRIIRNAGLTRWPRLFQNMRSSRITELAEHFPAHVLDSWFGNTETVREAHYLQTTTEHYDRAVQPTDESTPDTWRQDRAQKRGQTMLSCKRQPVTGSATNTSWHEKSRKCLDSTPLSDGPGGTRTGRGVRQADR